jgi:hypothetical protein
MPRIAFVTFGILKEPWDHPAVQGFVERIDDTFADADASTGLIERHNGYDDDAAFGPWVTARFVTPDLAGREAQTLSLWTDLEAVFAFAYADPHAEALRHRTAWFLKPAWPTYAAWWVADDHRPTWQEAMARLEHLHDHGSSAVAFDFRSPFDAAGCATRLDRGSRRPTRLRA